MIEIIKKPPPSDSAIQDFLHQIDFKLPHGFIDFYSTGNGAEVFGGERYILLWPITEMAKMNEGYSVEEFAPEFFLIGTDGGGNAYAVEKNTGKIFEMPFIGMGREDAVYISDDFQKFIYGEL